MSIATGGQHDKQKHSHRNHKYDEDIKENERMESHKSNKMSENGVLHDNNLPIKDGIGEAKLQSKENKKEENIINLKNVISVNSSGSPTSHVTFTRTNSSSRNRSHSIIHSHFGSDLSEERVPPLFRFNHKLYPDNQLVALNEMLFPNKTGEAKYKLIRRLGIDKPAYDGSVPCVICRDLTTCSILNGYQIEEVYYPKNLNYLETCKVIESFGKRIEKLVFGNGKTFRDTAQCRGRPYCFVNIIRIIPPNYEQIWSCSIYACSTEVITTCTKTTVFIKKM